MNKEIKELRQEVASLKKKKQHFEERNKLKKEIVSLKKGFSVFAQFNPFRDVAMRENLREIWYPIRTYIINYKREERRQEKGLVI